MAAYQRIFHIRRRFQIIEPRVRGLCRICQDLQKEKDDLLFKAVENGHADCVKACIAAKADINAYKVKGIGKQYPLSYAIEKVFDDCVWMFW